MESNWKRRDSKIDVIRYVTGKGKVSRAEIFDFVGESYQEVNKSLEELVKNSSLKMESNDQNHDYDTFEIPRDIQKKSFNDLY